MTPEQLWYKFKQDYQVDTDEYDTFRFGMTKEQADDLVQLVIDNDKVATTSAYPLYVLDNEELPKVDEYSIILDGNNQPRCIIQTTNVYVIPFNQVTQEHAFKEGEGDKSLQYWQHVHRQFFTQELENVGLSFDENVHVVCEEFKVVYK